MPHFLRSTGRLFLRAGHRLIDHDGVELAGYLTFLSLLSLFPFLVILVSITGFIGQGHLGVEFLDLIKHSLPKDVTGALMPRVMEITSGPPQALLTVSILTALWTASAAVEGMRTVLNRAYQVHQPPAYIWRRVMSVVQLLVITLMLIIAMLVLVFTPIVVLRFEALTGLSIPIPVAQFLRKDIVYIGSVLLFLGVASLYYWLPNIRQTALAVLPGALLVVVGWVLGAAGVTYYLEKISQVNMIYGSLSSFIATLLFFYVMNVVFIYGAEFNYALNVALGHKVEEREHVG